MPNKILSLDVNLTRFNTVMARYAHELQLAPREIVKSQAGLLMRELADGSAPENRDKMNKSIEKDVRRVYRPAPKQMLPLAHQKGRGFVWLMAGPNFLIGTKPNNYHMQDSLSDLQKLFHKSKSAQINPGPAYKDLGVRKLKTRWSIKTRRPDVQHVKELNRIVVKRAVYKQFLAWLKTRVGILGGSWAVAWDVLKPNGRIAAFKMKHATDGTAKGTYIDGLGIPGHARFTLINRATGVESDNSLKMINGVLLHRVEAMKVDIKNILKGAYKRAGWSRAK